MSDSIIYKTIPVKNTPLETLSNDEFLDYIIYIVLFLCVALFLVSVFYILRHIHYELFKRKRNISSDNITREIKPSLSAVLSFVFPGFGQLYNKQFYIGFIYIGLTLLIIFIVFLISLLPKDIIQIVCSILFILIFLFVYITGIRDAYVTALIINRKLVRTEIEKENNIENAMKMGRIYYEQRNYEAAINKCSEIISLNPNYKLAYYNRGIVYHELKNYKKALKDFISAAKLGDRVAEKILKSKNINTQNIEI